MRRLLLMRHAHAEDVGEGGGSDLLRPLSDRGRRDALRMGRWLQDQGLRPDRVISSGADRAVETARQVAHGLHFPPEAIQQVEQVYAAGLPALLQVLDDGFHTGTLLLVGHNPGVAALALALTGSGSHADADLRFPPGACVVFEFPDLGSVVQTGMVRCRATPETVPVPPREIDRPADARKAATRASPTSPERP